MFSEAGARLGKSPSNQEKIRYLKQYQALDTEINWKYRELEDLRSMLNKVTTIPSTQPQGGGTIYPKAEELIARIVDLEQEVNLDIDILVLLKQEIIDCIYQLEDNALKRVLYERYINKKVWEQIALDMCYSWRYIHKLHSKALGKLKI